MNANKRSVYCIEARTSAIRPGVFTEWKPWLNFTKKKDAIIRLRALKKQHKTCCLPNVFRLVEYTPTTGANQ